MNSPFRSCSGHEVQGAIFAVFLAALMFFVPAVATDGQTPDARAIMQGVYQQDTSHDTTFRADFEVFDKGNHASKKRFLFRRIGSPGSSKILVVFSDPQEIRGIALLSITQPGTPVRQYMYTPAIDRVRDVAPQERSARFIGTDFTYEDISEHVLEDFNYKLLNDGETVENHKTYKVQATPVDPQRSQYKFVYYWIAQDVPVILQAEMYDSRGKEIRTLHASDLKHVSGIWGARHLEMTSVEERTRTVLTIDEVKFNSGLDEKLFTPDALSKDRAQ
jgi:hypothetical protein